ncbi:MAG: preprotein translocase subunit SecE [Candidatus Andersenbacteria bacterium]|nr:preprotein translocase subunit SecE [Candidatus Andersenbacteria bacterium]
MKVTALPKQSIQFVKQSRDELKKVTWPSREQTMRYTVIVVVASIIVGATIGAFDYMLTLILESAIL